MPDRNPNEIKIDGIKKNEKQSLSDKYPFLKGKGKFAIISLILLVLVGGIAVAVSQSRNDSGDSVSQPTTDVVPKRDWSDDVGQSNLAKPKIIDGIGKGTITTVDNKQNGAKVSAPMVGIDAIGGQSGATLAPPEDISTVGWYVRSAKFGSNNKGSSVITSHIDYNGVTGYGSIFTSLKKGDPITVTDASGKEYHYIVNASPVNINKSDADYTKKTMKTINKMKGRNDLVLVTCGGQFLGSSSPLGYADNIVVVATPVSKTGKVLK